MLAARPLAMSGMLLLQGSAEGNVWGCTVLHAGAGEGRRKVGEDSQR